MPNIELIINNHSQVEQVNSETEKYFQSHPDLHDGMINHINAYYEIGNLIPQTIDNMISGHFFPYSESYMELENSFELCKQGFYRHSLFSLRCVLELGITGLFYDKNDQAHEDIQDWLRSIDKTPRLQKSLQDLFVIPNFKIFNDVFSLKRKIENTYSIISNYVHVRGYKYSSHALTRANFNQFNESSLNQYYNKMLDVVKNLVIMMLLKYPIGMQYLPLWAKFGYNEPVGGFLNTTSQAIIFSILDEDTKTTLKGISDNDPMVREIVKQINEMPDFTDEQLKQQRIENPL